MANDSYRGGACGWWGTRRPPLCSRTPPLGRCQMPPTFCLLAVLGPGIRSKPADCFWKAPSLLSDATTGEVADASQFSPSHCLWTPKTVVKFSLLFARNNGRTRSTTKENCFWWTPIRYFVLKQTGDFGTRSGVRGAFALCSRTPPLARCQTLPTFRVLTVFGQKKRLTTAHCFGTLIATSREQRILKGNPPRVMYYRSVYFCCM